MVRPSPVPPAFFPESLCWNGAKMSSICSGEMPTPLSSTSTESRSSRSSEEASRKSVSVRKRTVTLPCCVNLRPFPTRLTSTCRSFPSSPRSVAARRSSSCSIVRESDFSSASVWKSETISRSMANGLNGALFKVILPDSIFAMSRMSLISASRCSPLRLMIRTYFMCFGASSGSRSRSCEKPRIAFIGVRISWLMLARKALFARLAAFAASRAARRSSSIRLRSVISRLIPRRPISSPSFPRKDVLSVSRSARLPSG